MRYAGARAEEVATEGTLVRLSAEGFDAFTAAIEIRAAVVPELVELFKRKGPWANRAG